MLNWSRLRDTAARRWRWIAGAVVGLAVGGLLGWLLWPVPDTPAAPRERQYRDFTGCLLTDQGGVGGADAKPVWAGMQDASLSTSVRVQYLSVTGEQTVEGALPFLTSLAQSRCAVVFAAGPVPVGAVERVAGQFPEGQFVVVNGGVPAANVTRVDGTTGELTRTAVRQALIAATPK